MLTTAAAGSCGLNSNVAPAPVLTIRNLALSTEWVPVPIGWVGAIAPTGVPDDPVVEVTRRCCVPFAGNAAEIVAFAAVPVVPQPCCVPSAPTVNGDSKPVL